ncbi:MAG TPA: transglycosylase SLT domain-containing protein [Acetobacteraceae bacterium]|nr:transglycosylase SLT domain-containing protein [Acetobacteraceae bacterium]
MLLRRSSAAAAAIAAFMLGSPASGASADQTGSAFNEEMALAVPRVQLPQEHGELSLPVPLDPDDAARARRIFAALTSGHPREAARERKELRSHLLDGPILAALYLGPGHRSTPAELEAWLRNYGDEPDAGAIRALLRRRLPRGAAMPGGSGPPMLAPVRPAGQTADPPGSEPTTLVLDPRLRADVATLLRDQRYQTALKLIAPRAAPDGGAAALLRSEVARALFVHNWDAEALQVAAAAWDAAAPPPQSAEDAFIAGLASWRLGRIARAETWFEHAANAAGAPDETRASGAFWAARAALRRGDRAAFNAWLRRAGAESRTFYGLIARRMLGWGTGLILGRDLLSEADVDALAGFEAGERAFALIEIGQTDRAEAELRTLWPIVAADPPLRRALLLVAASAHMTDLAAQLAALVQTADGVPHDALLFPVPRLSPAGGFTIDPALVYGLTRTESGFRPDAVSSAGARGLMQITPVAARAVMHAGRVTLTLLDNPAANLGLGQRLLADLARQPAVGGDLIRLLAAYNDGPGGLASWDTDVRAPAGDPFLYIEAIPVPETRRFVRLALTNTWIYAARLGLPAPSLDALAGGRRPSVRPELEPPGRAVRVALRAAAVSPLP